MYGWPLRRSCTMQGPVWPTGACTLLRGARGPSMPLERSPSDCPETRLLTASRAPARALKPAPAHVRGDSNCSLSGNSRVDPFRARACMVQPKALPRTGGRLLLADQNESSFANSWPGSRRGYVYRRQLGRRIQADGHPPTRLGQSHSRVGVRLYTDGESKPHDPGCKL